MAECNTCGGYLSIEDKIRLSMKCDANGNVVWQGAKENAFLQNVLALNIDSTEYYLTMNVEEEENYIEMTQN